MANETELGKAPTIEERKTAAATNEDLDDMFDGAPDVKEISTGAAQKLVEKEKEPDPEPEPKPLLKPANPPAKVEAVPPVEEEEPPSKRQPRTLHAIPPKEEEEVVEEEEPEIKIVKKEEKVEQSPATQSPEMVKMLAEALKQAFPEKVAKEEKEPELTDEQRDAALKVYKPAADLVARLANPETNAAALQELISGIREEQRTFAFLTASRLVKDTLVTRDQQQQQQSSAQQELNKVREEFFTEYPVLKDEKFMPTVKAATLLLKSEGFQPKDTADFKKTLAEKTETLLKGANPTFSLASKPKTTTTVPKPAVQKARGGGGDGGQDIKPTKGQKAQGSEVFD